MTRRRNDISITGNLEDVLTRYALGKLTNGAPEIPLEEVDHIHITADNRLLKVIQNLRKGVLASHFTKNPATTGSVYSNMQCMLRVCAHSACNGKLIRKRVSAPKQFSPAPGRINQLILLI